MKTESADFSAGRSHGRFEIILRAEEWRAFSDAKVEVSEMTNDMDGAEDPVRKIGGYGLDPEPQDNRENTGSQQGRTRFQQLR